MRFHYAALVLFASVVSSSSSQARAETQPLSAEQIKKTVESKMSDLKACLAVDPPPTGKLVVHYVILPTGKVDSPKAKESTTQNAKLDRCILEVFRKLTFPPPAGGATMEQLYPFTFAAPKAAPAPTAKLEEKQVIDTVTAHTEEIKACTGDATKGKAGQLTVEVDIASTGAVTAARKKASTTGADAFDTCVLTAIRKWQFPKPQGTGALTLAFPIALVAK